MIHVGEHGALVRYLQFLPCGLIMRSTAKVDNVTIAQKTVATLEHEDVKRSHCKSQTLSWTEYVILVK